LRRLLIAAGMLVAFAGPSLAGPAVTVRPSAMLRSANPHARIVQAVPANAQVDIQSCSAYWCFGSWRHRHGFLPAYAVGMGPPPPFEPTPPPPLVVTAPIMVAPPPPPPPVWGGPFVGFGWGRW